MSARPSKRMSAAARDARHSSRRIARRRASCATRQRWRCLPTSRHRCWLPCARHGGVMSNGGVFALFMVALGMLIDGPGDQDSIFSAAQAYEHFMGRWSRSLAPLFVRFAGVRNGDTVLDVGSGTGALTAAVAKTAPSSRIVGIDPAAPYVALAQSQQGSGLIRFEVGDAQQMPFDNAMFDRTVSLLVVNFIPDARKAIGEMKRVTKSKGTIAAAVWDYGEGMEMLRVFWDEAVALTPAAAAKDQRNVALRRRGELA